QPINYILLIDDERHNKILYNKQSSALMPVLLGHIGVSICAELLHLVPLVIVLSYRILITFWWLIVSESYDIICDLHNIVYLFIIHIFYMLPSDLNLYLAIYLRSRHLDHIMCVACLLSYFGLNLNHHIRVARVVANNFQGDIFDSPHESQGLVGSTRYKIVYSLQAKDESVGVQLIIQ
ncbi:hypothetical protein ACJX0J_038840, partial [Zea mays]